MLRQRNFGWDSLKGFLIIMVIVGHVVPLSLDDSLLRAVIYSFHMPLFFFVSGFLFNLKRSITLSPIQLLSQYKKRVIVPWFLAVVVYCGLCIYVYGSHQNPLIVVLRHFVKPYFHLWFVPSLFLFILLTQLLYRYIHSWFIRLCLVLILSLLFYGISHGIDVKKLPIISDALILFQSTFRLQYLIFFVFGVITKQNVNRLCRFKSLRLIYPVYCVVVIWNFYLNLWVLDLIVFFVANGLLAFQIASDIQSYQGKGFWVFNFFGFESMGIYLWHYVCTMLVKFWLGTDDLWLYYCWNAFGLLLTFGLLYLFTKYKWTHQLLMGNGKG